MPEGIRQVLICGTLWEAAIACMAVRTFGGGVIWGQWAMFVAIVAMTVTGFYMLRRERLRAGDIAVLATIRERERNNVTAIH